MMKPQFKTFLMFDGTAEDAMNFYVSLFEDAKIITIVRYGPGEMGAEGTCRVPIQPEIRLGGGQIRCRLAAVSAPCRAGRRVRTMPPVWPGSAPGGRSQHRASLAEALFCA
jgi:uncharacterized glyoxalase superfamily protein PhnB